LCQLQIHFLNRHLSSGISFLEKILQMKQRTSAKSSAPNKSLGQSPKGLAATAPMPAKPQADIKSSLDFVLETDFIPLVALLKVAGLVSSGGQAKWMVSEGAVYVDRVMELRKTCKIRGGQKVQMGTTEIKVHATPREVL
jgi:ribosome-associated protein